MKPLHMILLLLIATLIISCNTKTSTSDANDPNTGSTFDNTPPSDISEVRDGLGPDIDTQASTSQLSANWEASTDAESGIATYWYGIGTSAGETDVLDWTDNGAAQNVTVSGLSLKMGGTYYFTVKAENGASLQSLHSTASDGITLTTDNQPPQIDTPAHAVVNPVTYPSNTTLKVIASDSDAGPTALTYTWTQVSGPDPTALFLPNSTTDADTCIAAFSAEGDYTLRVTVSDGKDAVTSDLTITVNPPSKDDIIPSSYRINWNPGIEGGIPHYPDGVNVKDYGAIGDGKANDTDKFEEAIKATPEGTAVIIPAGTYYIDSTLAINKAIALRGAGYERTTLLFDINTDLISIRGESFYDVTNWVNITGGFSKGSNQITVADASGFAPGDYVEITQDMDPAVYFKGQGTGWLEDQDLHGQLLQVASVSGRTLTFYTPLYFTYNAAIGPRIAKRNLFDGAGVEYLKLERKDTVKASGNKSYNIKLNSAANCWVRNVWSEKGMNAHLSVVHSYRCEIRGSVFNDAIVSGDGGQGYGASLGFHASDCLIEDNIFMRLRASMMIQLGVTGSVFGYNYARDTFKDSYDVMYPGYEISVHGHYPTMNLFEGNTVQRGKIGNYWGRNGPTTFLRNRFEKHPSAYPSALEGNSYGRLVPPYRRTILQVWENNPYHNIIGNEIGIEGTWETNGNPLDINPDSADDCIVHGNHSWEDQTIQWDPAISEREIPVSYYLTSKPAFFGNLPFPCIGADMPSEYIIPAQQRFNSGKLIDD